MKADTGEYLEMVKFKENQGSWMADSCVEQDGSLYVAAPLDPLYFVVALLREAEGFKPFDMVAASYPELVRVLGGCVGRLTQLCDIVDVEGGQPWYRYNEFLCLRWLTNKVAAVAATLESTGVPVVAGEDYTVMAYSIIAGYVPELLACELKSYLGLDAPPATVCSTQHVLRGKAQPKLLAAGRQEKAAGMSCIASFFAHK